MSKIVKKVKEVVKKAAPQAKVQRLVAARNVDRLKAEGYSVAKEGAADAKGKILGVRTHTDLVLMEK